MQDTKNIEVDLRRRLSKYRNLPDWDDAVQEALIQTWRDQEERGITDPGQLRARGTLRGKAILMHQTGATGGSTMTGHVGRKSTEGVSREKGERTREKIRIFEEEFTRIHDRKPSGVEIMKGTGLSRDQVYGQLKKTSTGVSVPVKEVKLQALWNQEGAQDEDTTLAIQRSAIEWEQDLINQLTVQQLMLELTDRQRQAVYGTHWLRLSTRELATQMGINAKNVRDHLNAAYNKMRKAL